MTSYTIQANHITLIPFANDTIESSTEKICETKMRQPINILSDFFKAKRLRKAWNSKSKSNAKLSNKVEPIQEFGKTFEATKPINKKKTIWNKLYKNKKKINTSGLLEYLDQELTKTVSMELDREKFNGSFIKFDECIGFNKIPNDKAISSISSPIDLCKEPNENDCRSIDRSITIATDGSNRDGHSPQCEGGATKDINIIDNLRQTAMRRKLVFSNHSHLESNGNFEVQRHPKEEKSSKKNVDDKVDFDEFKCNSASSTPIKMTNVSDKNCNASNDNGNPLITHLATVNDFKNSPIATATKCAKNIRICTPYKIRKNNEFQIARLPMPTECSSSANNCQSRTNNETPTRKSLEFINNDVSHSKKAKTNNNTDRLAKSSSISKFVIKQFSRIRKTTKSLVAATPRIFSNFI